MNGYELDTEKAIEIFSKVSKILRPKYGDSVLLSLGDMSTGEKKRRSLCFMQKILE